MKNTFHIFQKAVRELAVILTFTVVLSTFASPIVDVSPHYPISFTQPDSGVFYWINQGDINAGTDWLEKGGDLTIHNGHFTPLGHAILSQQPEIIKLLINAGSDVSRKYLNHQNAIQLAVLNADTATIGVLLEAGAGIDESGTIDSSLVFGVVENNRIETLKYLIRRGIGLETLQGQWYREGTTSPLHLAAESGYLPIMKVLLDADANIEILNSDNKTPLQTAWDIFPKRVYRSSRLSSADFIYVTESMIQWRSKESFMLLLEHGADLTKLKVAPEEILTRGTWFQMPDLMELGFEMGADVNMRIKSEFGTGGMNGLIPQDALMGRQLIHLAAKLNALDAMKLLIKYGASITVPDTNGQTPFTIAVKASSMDVIDFLLSEGISPTATDAKGTPALQIALGNARYDLYNYLQEKGAIIGNFNIEDSQPLVQAVINDKPEIVEMLLESGFDPNCSFNDTLLKTVSDIPVEKEELEEKADVEDTKRQYLPGSVFELDVEFEDYSQVCPDEIPWIKYKPPLHYAVINGNEKICKLLINAGANVNLKDNIGISPLVHAVARVKSFNYSIIKLLLEKGADPNQTLGQTESLVHIAVKREDPILAKMLLESGADPNSKDYRDRTPIEYCYDPKNIGILQPLIESGAKLSQRGKYSWEMLMQSIRERNADLLRLIIEIDTSKRFRSFFAHPTPLINAINNKDPECIKILFEAGFGPGSHLSPEDLPERNTTWYIKLLETEQWSLMKQVVAYGYRILLEDEDIYIKDDAEYISLVLRSRKVLGEKPLIKEPRAIYLAVANNAVKCVQLFIDAGVDLNVKNNNGQTPIWKAMSYSARESQHQSKKTEVIELLLANGANPDQTDYFGFNLLCTSCDNQADWMVELLLKAGAHANSFQNGKFALHYAVARKDTTIAQMLIDYGAYTGAVDWDNKTPLQVAQDAGDSEMVKLLEEAKAAREQQEKKN